MQLRIPGWVDVTRRTLKEVKQDNLAILAAGVAFWFFLALVPTIVAVINVYGLVADPSDVSKLVARFNSTLPHALVQFIDEQLRSITQSSSSKLGVGLAFALAAAIWSSARAQGP